MAVEVEVEAGENLGEPVALEGPAALEEPVALEGPVTPFLVQQVEHRGLGLLSWLLGSGFVKP